MPIVSSEAIFHPHTQPGGGRYVSERHVDDAGQVWSVDPYLVPANFDVQARLAARVIELNASLAQREADALFGG